MIEELLEIYNNSKLNKGEPKCIFAENELIFNEGWLLIEILKRCKELKGKTKFPFLPFPDDVKIYTEGQLYTPFKAISKIKGNYAETNTHVDGIVGNYSITKGTKHGIKLDEDFKYLSVFEAKIYSPLQKGIKNADNYSQVSRNIACIINSVIKTNRCNVQTINFIVIYPRDSKIKPEKYTEEFVEREIDGRLMKYENDVSANQDDKKYDDFFHFKKQWKDLFKDIKIHFITWEEIISEFEEQDNINSFYDLCKKFNR